MFARLALLGSLTLALSLTACGGGGGGGSSGSSAGASTAATLAPTKLKAATIVARSSSGKGWLEDNQGKHFLHVKGTPREMGEQYGELVGADIEELLNRLPAYAASQHFPAQFLPGIAAAAAAVFSSYFPPDVMDYLNGVEAGMQRQNPATTVTLTDLIFLNSIVDLGGVTNGIVNLCSSVAVWGDLTVSGKMFQTRCIDLFIGSGLENHACVIIEKRNGKTPWANAAWTGMVGSASGMNAHGLAIGQVWAFSDDKGFGEPWILTTRRIMENAVDSEDAVTDFAALTGRRTYGANFVFGDKGDGRGGQPKAWAIESSQSYMATFQDNDPKEDLALSPGNPVPYSIRIPNAVFRGDSCMDPGMRSRQTASNGPTGDPRGANAYQRRYKGQADRVLAYKAAGVKIGAPELIALTQGVATPGGSLQCCVYANSDLQLWVANAHTDLTTGASIDSFNQPYVQFDFDYYLPTVQATLDRASYGAGQTQVVTFTTSTLGSDRDLALSFRVEGPGGTVVQHVNNPGALPTSFRAAAGARAQAIGLVLPATLTPGSYKLVAELDERGTTDLVDLAVVPFTIQ